MRLEREDAFLLTGSVPTMPTLDERDPETIQLRIGVRRSSTRVARRMSCLRERRTNRTANRALPATARVLNRPGLVRVHLRRDHRIRVPELLRYEDDVESPPIK